MTAPDRIWAVHHETQGAVMIGEWADTVRHLGGTEYIRFDLHAALQAENERLREVLREIAGLGIVSASDLAVIALRRK